MNDNEIVEYIKDALYCYASIDLYDISDLLDQMSIEMSEEERDDFETQLLEIVENIGEDYEDQIAWDILTQFKELLKDRLPHYPEDNPGQLHLFED